MEQDYFYSFEKKIILLPQTIGPFNIAILKFAAKNTLKVIDLIFVRDILSSKFLRELFA